MERGNDRLCTSLFGPWQLEQRSFCTDCKHGFRFLGNGECLAVYDARVHIDNPFVIYCFGIVSYSVFFLLYLLNSIRFVVSCIN